MLCMLTRYSFETSLSSRALITAGSVMATCLLTNGCSYSKNQFHMRKQDWRDQKFGLIAAIPKLDAISTEPPFFPPRSRRSQKENPFPGLTLTQILCMRYRIQWRRKQLWKCIHFKYPVIIYWIVQHLDVYRRDISTSRPSPTTTHPRLALIDWALIPSSGHRDWLLSRTKKLRIVSCSVIKECWQYWLDPHLVSPWIASSVLKIVISLCSPGIA